MALHEPQKPSGNEQLHHLRAEAARRLREFDRNDAMVRIARRVRHRLPGDPGFGDPLSTAGSSSAQSVARLLDRYLDTERPASREWALGALQVWQSGLERVGRGQGDREVTIVFTDLVGFSSWALVAGDEETLTLLRSVAAVLEPRISAHHGQVVKRTGDGLMAVFATPADAFEAVIEGREQLTEVQIEGFSPVLRVGIHTGTPRQIGGDWLGVDVNVAARLMQHSGAGNIGISGPALEEIPHERLEELGLVARTTRRILPENMAGVPHDLATYVVGPPPSSVKSGLLGWLPGSREDAG